MRVWLVFRVSHTRKPEEHIVAAHASEAKTRRHARSLNRGNPFPWHYEVRPLDVDMDPQDDPIQAAAWRNEEEN